MPPLLEVNNLHTSFKTRDGVVHAVNGVSFSVQKGRVLALLGESGSGKSVTLRTIMRLLPKRTTTAVGEVKFNGEDLLNLSEQDFDVYRGRRISMVFQEPTAALDPVFTIGQQLGETIRRHNPGIPKRAVDERSLELLRMVQIPTPERRLHAYPHEMSGGMKQRAMIAVALASRPDLLFADEPTTALDVTVQAQVLHLMRSLQNQLDMAMVLVTHDIGVVAEIADDVAVMYAGRIVEFGPVQTVLKQPVHPYTEGLIKATVKRGQRGTRLYVIPGQPPNLLRLPAGCAFAARCPYASAACVEAVPDAVAVSSNHMARCIIAAERAAETRTPPTRERVAS